MLGRLRTGPRCKAGYSNPGSNTLNLAFLRVASLLLAALAMGMHLAHALELLPKLKWGPELYLAVQSTLYRLFGIIGPILEVGALVLVSLLAVKLGRGHPARKLTLGSAAAIALSLFVWAAVVLPANGQLANWQASGVTPPDWTRWRDQWQFGQAFIFLLHLGGFTALASAMLKPDRDV